MIDILVKSFNRPYYLDRCLNSIKTFVSGDYSVKVLDDGTPEKYLAKIQEKYPEVIVLKSKNYNKKNQAIINNLEQGKDINGFQIPTDLWIETAKNSSEYFIMTEDDVWFTEKINIDELVRKSKKHQVSLLKLGWLNNYRDDKWVRLEIINNDLVSTQPKDLFLTHPIIMDWFFYNKFKFFSLAYKLKIFDNQAKLKYWVLNSILMGLWHKDYWLAIWKDAQGEVNEKQQLRNAAIYYRDHKDNKNFIARLKTEAMKTTFQSSATNSYHEYGFDFDVNLFNHLINESWYNEEFNAMQNFPEDFSLDYFISFIKDKINVEEYKKWAEKFKQQYTNSEEDIH